MASFGEVPPGVPRIELLIAPVSVAETAATVNRPSCHSYPREKHRCTEYEARGIEVKTIEVRGPETLVSAFRLAGRKTQAVLVLSDPYMFAHKRRIVELATGHRLADMHTVREFVDAGGLIAYGPNAGVMFRGTAEYIDKVLEGAEPVELPIEQPTQYELL